MTDPISDMLTRIRNAVLANKRQVELPHSKAKEAIARALASSGFIESVKTQQQQSRKFLLIDIAEAAQSPNISHIKRLSKPGRRAYVQAKDIPSVKSGRGVVIVSTSKEVMTGAQAVKAGLGGELICEVY